MLGLNILNSINSIQNRIFKQIGNVISLNDHLALKENIKNKRDLKNIELLDVNANSKFFNHSLEQILLLNLDNFPMNILNLEKMLRGEDIKEYNKYSELLEVFEKENFDVPSIKYRSLLYKTYLLKGETESEELRKELENYISFGKWESLNEFHYGVSNLLHSALNLFQTSKTHENKFYLEQCSERILRKLEIGRDKCIDFKGISINNQKVLEQLKIINFCLRLCDESKDLRFLNAAMKATDRIFNHVKKINLNKSLDFSTLEVLLLYILNVDRQEYLFKELV